MKHTRTIKVARNLCFLVISVLLCTALPVESRPPEFVDCPSDTIWGSACDVFQAQVRAVNHSWPGMTGGIRYILIDGPGSVEPQTGVWSYVPSVQDLGKTLEVEIAAYNGEIMTSGAQNCRFQVAVAPNYPPPDSKWLHSLEPNLHELCLRLQLLSSLRLPGPDLQSDSPISDNSTGASHQGF